MNTPSPRFITRMIVRELRSEWRLLTAALIPIVVGVIVITALQTLHHVVQTQLSSEQQALLGSDLSIKLRGKPTPGYKELISQIPGVKTSEIRFPTIVHGENGSELVQIQALSGKFPFYGERVTEPPGVEFSYLDGKSILLDKVLQSQLKVAVGESLQIGKSTFTVAGFTTDSSGETELRMTLAPRIILHQDTLEATGLTEHGIRQRVVTHFKFEVPPPDSIKMKQFRDLADEIGADFQTPTSQREQFGDNIDRVYSYLSLFGVATLIVGALGAACGGAYYAARKQRAAALLRCLGTSTNELVGIFVLTFLVSSFLASLIGVATTIPLLKYLFAYAQRFFPLNLPTEVAFSDLHFIFALVIGSVTPLLFAFPAIFKLRKIPPLFAARRDVESGSEQRGLGMGTLVIAIATLLLISSTIFSSNRLIMGVSLALVGLVLIQIVATRVIQYLLKLPWIRALPFSIRHGLAAIRRPGNESLFVAVLIGVPAFLTLSIWIIQQTLVAELNGAMEKNKENTILFDVQPDQVEMVKSAFRAEGVQSRGTFPLVSMRLSSINGALATKIAKGVKDRRHRWYLTREYQNTYRNELSPNEKLLSGSMPTRHISQENSLIPISVEKRMVERLSLKLGDKLRFNVQGLPLDTEIVGIREFNFRAINPGFLVVFPTGVLEEAPHSLVMTAESNTSSQFEALRQSLRESASNISVIDSEGIKETIQNIFEQLGGVVQIVGALFVCASLILIISVVHLSAGNRASEQKLYRTLGAKRMQLLGMQLVEFSSTGVIGAVTGAIISLIFAGVSLQYFWDIQVQFPISGFLLLLTSIALSMALIGFFSFFAGSRSPN